MAPTDLLLSREEVEIVETWMKHWDKRGTRPDSKSLALMNHVSRFLHPLGQNALSPDQKQEGAVVYRG